MRSMTGYGSGLASLEDLQITVQIQSVNRRGLETAFSMPREWQDWENAFTERIRQECFRGKVQVAVDAVRGAEAEGLYWDEAALDATLDRLQQLARKLQTPWPPDMDALIRLISTHKNDSGLPLSDEARGALETAFGEALEAFIAMREKEGNRLRDDLRDRLQRIQAYLETIVEHSGDSVARYRNLLFERLQNAGLELDLDDERVLKEVALFADRCDISEEVTRLGSHFSQFSEVVEGSGNREPIGRKLEFILQEVNREFNTIGSKANRIEISQAVIESKNEIERIREQIQNVE